MPSKPTLELSRRACLPLLGAAAVAPAMLVLTPVPVAAQTRQEYKFDPAKLSWREYRRDDFGFRVELPDEPMITTDDSPEKPKTTVADVMFDRVTFGVKVREFREDRTTTTRRAKEMLDGIAAALEVTFGIQPESSRFTMNGAPGREDIFGFKDGIMHFRAVVHGGRLIQTYVHWHLPDVDIKPAAQRFLQSFTLLPVSR